MRFLLLALLSICFFSPFEASAGPVYSIYDGYITPGKPKALRNKGQTYLVCEGGTKPINVLFRLDRTSVKKQTIATLTFATGLIVKGPEVRGQVTATGKFSGRDYSITLKDTRKGLATLKISEVAVSVKTKCEFPYSGTVYRTDYTQ